MRQPQCRTRQGIHQHCADRQTIAQGGLDFDSQVLCFVGQIDAAGEQHPRSRAADIEIAGIHYPACYGHIPFYAIEGKTLAENIAKVEGDTAWQRLQTQDAEQTSDTRFKLAKLSIFQIHFEFSAQGRIVECQGRALPA